MNMKYLLKTVKKNLCGKERSVWKSNQIENNYKYNQEKAKFLIFFKCLNNCNCLSENFWKILLYSFLFFASLMNCFLTYCKHV